MPTQWASTIIEASSVHYQVGGEGRPLVFLHGIGGGSDDWSKNLDYFADRGFRVFAPDLPGHGRSAPPPRRWDPRDGGRTIVAMLDSWDIAKTTLIGNSAGGLLALQAALVAPDRIEALVLAAPAGLGRAVHRLLRLLAVPVAGEMLWRPWPLTGRLALRAVFADRSQVSPSLVDAWLARRRDPTERKTFLRLLRQGVGLRGLRRDLVLLEHLQDLRCPVLVVWGREDRVVPPSHARELTRLVPQARLLLLSPCGHWPQMEQASRFNREVEAFLAAVTDRAPGPSP